MHKRLFSLVLISSSACLVPAALADTVNFTLTTPSQSGPEGTVFTYDATVSAPSSNGATIYLNGDSFNGPLPINDIDFFSNFPPSLAPGANFTGDLFTVTAVAGSGGTTADGSFTLLGGATDTSTDTLGTVTFTTQVAAAATPEPASVWLLVTGVAGGCVLAGRRRTRFTAF